MIQEGSYLNITDNSGGKWAKCIKVLGGSRRRYARLGDIIVVTIKNAEPRKAIKKHEVVRVLIVRQRKEYRRKDGTYIRFEDNAGVVLDGKTHRPKGGRIFGPVAREIKEKGFSDVVSLAKELV